MRERAEKATASILPSSHLTSCLPACTNPVATVLNNDGTENHSSFAIA
jgi:hypothetical protein